jgi:putative hydrolase of the HAD superfamily
VNARIPQYAAEVRLAMKNWHCMMKTMPGMADIVSDLKKRGLKIYLLSNTSLRFYRYYRNVEVFRLFDGFVISARERLVKPDPAIFRRTCERFHLVPQECLFVDDVQENVDSAAGVGMNGHRFAGAEELRSFLENERIL